MGKTNLLSPADVLSCSRADMLEALEVEEEGASNSAAATNLSDP